MLYTIQHNIEQIPCYLEILLLLDLTMLFLICMLLLINLLR